MTPHELPRAVQRARWARRHRKIFQMAAHVRSQIRDGAVPSRAILLEGAHGDPIEVSTKLADECPTIALDRSGGSRPGLRDARARARRIDLANRPADFVETLFAERLAVERQ